MADGDGGEVGYCVGTMTRMPVVLSRFSVGAVFSLNGFET